MAQADRHGLRRLQEALGAVGEFFEVQDTLPNLSPSIWCCISATQGGGE
jgi:hypothetical protein